MSFSATQTNMNEILSRNTLYLIPYNQRKYVWGEQEWNDLFEDLFVIEQSDKYNHFMGSVVFAKEKKDSHAYSVIDGQQRLITLSIVLTAIVYHLYQIAEVGVAKSYVSTYLKGNYDGEEYHRISRLDGEFILSELIESTDSKRELSYYSQMFAEQFGEKDKYNERLLNCYIFMVNRINTMVKEEKNKKKILLNLKEKLINSEIIEIIVETDVDGFRVFETLNARGIPLEQHELIKNYLFSYTRTNAKRQTLNRRWKRIQENVTVDSTDYFSHFISNFCSHKYGKVSKNTEFKIIRMNTEKTEVEDLLELLYMDSVIYSYILSPENFRKSEYYSPKVFIALDFFKNMGIRQVRPLLISIFECREKGNLSDTEFEKCIVLLENFYFLYLYVLRYKTNITDDAIIKLAKSAHENANISSRKIIEELAQYLSGIEDLKEQFGLIAYSKKNPKFKNSSNRRLMKYVFYKFEKHLDVNGDTNPNIASIEHIASDDETITSRAYIGNLLPLSIKQNGKIGDKPLADKMVAYKKSNLLTVRSFVEHHSMKALWEESDIIERGKYLSIIAINDIWKFTE